MRSDEGLTMIEVVMAAMILTLGSLALMSLVSSQAHNTFRSEQSQVVSNRLQQEMEKIKNLPYSQIALSGSPIDTTDTSDPRWRVSGTNYSVTQDGTQLRPLVYDGSSLDAGGAVSGGAISPTPETFTSGDVRGTIYRFVTWENDANCPDASCPGSQDLKRVIVAIQLDTTPAGGARHYQEIQSQVADPSASVTGPHNPGGGNTPWTFFLTDTTCDHTARQPIIDNHLTHNTNGACGAQLKNANDCTTVLLVTSCPAGAPDLMFTQPAPLTSEQLLYDYATDVEPSVNQLDDKGLQLLKPSTSGCLSSLFQPLTNVSGALLGDPDANRMRTIHKWVSNPMGNGFNVILDGNGNLNLWTKTVNGQTYTGKICIWLFERHLSPLGVPIDTPAIDLSVPGGLTYFTYSPAGGVWPTSWTELHIQLHFNLQVNLGPLSRLGLAIQVERSGTSCTSPCGLEFMYDQPSFDSRLTVTTTSLLPF
jgi:hypothetical protein